MNLKKMTSALTAFVLTAELFGMGSPVMKAGAAEVKKFDLGANAVNGWTKVSASQKYSDSSGYGFSSNSEIKDVAASGKNELSDAVQFTGGKTTFDVKLDKGLYRVKVRLGNTSRTSVYMENMMQIVNMTGNNAYDEVLIPVTDGKLNIRAAAGKSGTAFSISSLEIEKVSSDPTLPPTIWVCGDSTVCNYYPLETSVQGGWAQMLGHYVDKGWNIRNLAASGQYAGGFVSAGQFTPIETYGKKGDVYIISIGINDSKYYKGDEYKKIVTDMVKRAKAKGMDVILVKQQGRNGDAQKKPLLTSRWFAAELDSIGKSENVQVVDLFKLWQDYCIKIGADKTTALYMNGDQLHPNRAGAEKLAELFASQFKQKPSAYNPEPPASQAPASQPPASQAPASQPPASQAPASQPPASQAPASQPPVSQAPVDTSNVTELVLGDINGDSSVNIRDMVLMKSELVSPFISRPARRNADVNADGNVDATDAVQLLRYFLNNEEFEAVRDKKVFAYATDQKYSEAVVEDTNKGSKEGSYINLENKSGSSISWKIKAPEDGNYLCSFSVANGSKDNRKMKVEVEGNSRSWVQDFLTTGDWTTWEERGIVIPLSKGNNTIILTSLSEQGGPNFDYMTAEWTDEPAASDGPAETQKPAESDQSKVSRTIYIAGDSTVQTYKASEAPLQGWGAYLSSAMPEGVTVSNHAIAGRSSKSFYDNGRLDTILGTIKKNDYLLVQFGINDAASSKPERYAPVSGKVPGSSGSFEGYMAKYIEGAKEKGATPVLVTTVIGLKAYDSGSKKFKGSYDSYCKAMKQLADYYKIPCIDLNTLMVNHYNSIGYDAAYKYHMCSTGSTDMTHFTETGAKAVAKLVADEMKKQGLI